MTEYIVIFVTVGSQDEAERIAEALVAEHLAACVNVVGPLRSIYWWEGRVQRDQELLLLIKTRAALFAGVEQRVKQLHSYQTPEVIAVPITAGSTEYLRWLGAGSSAKP
jgi:periplasmic divalent cation tolerance protein